MKSDLASLSFYHFVNQIKMITCWKSFSGRKFYTLCLMSHWYCGCNHNDGVDDNGDEDDDDDDDGEDDDDA